MTMSITERVCLSSDTGRRDHYPTINSTRLTASTYFSGGIKTYFANIFKTKITQSFTISSSSQTTAGNFNNSLLTTAMNFKALDWETAVKTVLASYPFRCIDKHHMDSYISDIVQTTAASSCRHGLRSSTDTLSYTVPPTVTKFGERAFSLAGASVWNSLPADIRHVTDTCILKRRLKAHFFNLYFNT